jgi:hypothetical protein
MMHPNLIAILVALLASAAPVFAQEKRCHPVSPTDRVVVSTTDGRQISGTLLCLGDDAAAVLARDGKLTDTPLAEITRIRTKPDPVWDGGVKGAAIPLILWAVFCHGCEGAASPVLKSAAAYGLIGLAWDALETHQRTIYRGPRGAPSMAWRLRF